MTSRTLVYEGEADKGRVLLFDTGSHLELMLDWRRGTVAELTDEQAGKLIGELEKWRSR